MAVDPRRRRINSIVVGTSAGGVEALAETAQASLMTEAA